MPVRLPTFSGAFLLYPLIDSSVIVLNLLSFAIVTISPLSPIPCNIVCPIPLPLRLIHPFSTILLTQYSLPESNTSPCFSLPSYNRSMHFCIAFVSSVFPSPFAPYHSGITVLSVIDLTISVFTFFIFPLKRVVCPLTLSNPKRINNSINIFLIIIIYTNPLQLQ